MKNKFSKEDMYKNLEIINQWINNSDSKTSIVLGLVGILLTIIFTNSTMVKTLLDIIKNLINNVSFSDVLYLLLLGYTIFICFYGLWLLIRVLLPTLKMNKKEIKSYMYFGSVSNYATFKDFKDELENASDEDIIDDLLNQIYQNSIICNKKYINFINGIKYFLIGFVTTIIMYGIGILVYL